MCNQLGKEPNVPDFDKHTNKQTDKAEGERERETTHYIIGVLLFCTNGKKLMRLEHQSRGKL